MLSNMYRPFYFYCQKVLPLVFDESLSYYEVLCKVRDKLNALGEVSNEMQEAISRITNILNDFINGKITKEYLEQIIDEMVESGEMEDLLILAGIQIKSYHDNTAGWDVLEVRDNVKLSNRFTVSGEPTAHTNNTELELYGTIGPFSLPTAMPMDDISVSGAVNAYSGFLGNAKALRGCTIEYTPTMLDNDGWAEETTQLGVSITVNGVHKKPSATPLYPYNAAAEQAVAIAKTYYDSLDENRVWSYGANFVTYNNNTVVNDEAGRGKMECDSLVAMVMLGIPYALSPYANTDANATKEFSEMTINPNNYGWCLPWTYNAVLGRKVTWTGGQNWWLWDNGLTFKYIGNEPKKGDIVIFTKPTSKYFDHIYHIGIIDLVRVNGVDVPYVYHFTASNLVDTPMQYEPLTNVIERGNYDISTDVYFARPNYGA